MKCLMHITQVMLATLEVNLSRYKEIMLYKNTNPENLSSRLHQHAYADNMLHHYAATLCSYVLPSCEGPVPLMWFKKNTW